MAGTSSALPRGASTSGAEERYRASSNGGLAGVLQAIRLRELTQTIAVAQLVGLSLLLPLEFEPLVALVVLTGSGLSLAVLLLGLDSEARSSKASRPAHNPTCNDRADLSALSPGYAAVLAALKSSEISFAPAAEPVRTEASALADLKAEQCLSGSAALMARVSHELRTPLNAVIGFSDLMSGELFGPLGHARYREYVRHINDSGRELLKSAEDTLALTSLLAHQDCRVSRSPVAIGPLAAHAWSFFADEAARREICLDARGGAGIEAMAERRAMRQVLVNLFSQALEHAADGASVLLFVEADGDQVQIEVAVEGTVRCGETRGDALAICLARHLLALQGASLAELGSASGDTWRAVTVLDRAVQPDLFGAKGLG